MSPRLGHLVVLAAGVAAAVSGCAARAQSPQAVSKAAGAEEVVRDDFDPALFREDLILIEPVFGLPQVESAPGLRSGAPAAAPATSASVREVFRVQVIALSRPESAQRVAADLRRRLSVPVDVVPQGRLFAVRAGRFDGMAAAGQLKGELAVLSEEYAGAFVVADSPAAVDAPHSAPAGDARVAGDGAATGEVPAPEPALVLTQGWRVRIDQFLGLDGAIASQARVLEHLNLARGDVDVVFEAPWHKVMAGNFRTAAEAQQFAERCRALGYRNATKVRSEVHLPKGEVSEP